MTKITEIKTIDIIVFPDWCGGNFVGNYYIDPVTLTKEYFNTFASEELAAKWVERAREIETDESRLLVHIHEGKGNTSTYPHLQDYVKLIEDILNPTGRFIEESGYNLEESLEVSLADRVKRNGLTIHPDVKVYGYGHHRGDCVPDYGAKATVSLGLNESRFEEIRELGVGDKVYDMLDIIKEENPTLYWHYSEEHIDQIRARKDWQAVGLIMDAPRYLFIYCTKDQVRKAAKSASSVEEFEKLIGGHFKGFSYLDDYFAMRDKHNIKDEVNSIEYKLFN